MESLKKVVVGLDPDSEFHGIGVYCDGKLMTCATATTVEIITDLLPVWNGWGTVIFSIENVMANQFVYARNQHSSKSAQSKIAMHIGRCQQAQVELMRWLDRYEIPYVLHKPQKGNWADDKNTFERVTGWVGRSNKDGRSGAYFGWLEARR